MNILKEKKGRKSEDMAIEYKIYKNNDIALAEQLGKEKEKLKNSFAKSVENIISKNYDNQELKEGCEKLISSTKVSIEKILGKTAEGQSVCTVTSTKIYWELEEEQLKEFLETGNYIIVGDDGSKYKTYSAFKKILKL